jgi:hypothetical protein
MSGNPCHAADPTDLSPQPQKCQKSLAKQQFCRLESGASQRISDPAAKDYEFLIHINVQVNPT